MAKFLEEIPINAEIMSVTAINNIGASVSNIIWSNLDPVVDATIGVIISNSKSPFDLSYVAYFESSQLGEITMQD